MIGPITLSVDDGLPEARRVALARALAQDLSRAGAVAAPAQGAAAKGERGLVAEIGKLVIDKLGGSVATGALDVLKSYFIRERSLKLVLTRPDGSKIEVDAKNVDGADVAAFIGAARGALD